MKSVLDCARALIDMLEVLADRGALPFGMPEQVQALRDAIDRDSTCSDALRDQFAGQAMQALLMTDMVPGTAHDALAAAAKQAGRTPVQQLALDAWEVADRMLAARDAAAPSSGAVVRPRIPASYIGATWRSTLPLDSATGKVGLSFDVDSQRAPLRLHLSAADARHVIQTLAQALE